jgi:hypothetical protein
MSLFPIFKVNKLTDKNVTETIYVFYGSLFSEEIEDPNDLFEDEPTNKAFNDVFNKEELDYIQKNKVEVIFINQSIHIDDSIGVIKLKIFDAINKEASMSELYLYCLKSEKLNPITVYQNLTQNDKLPLTKIRIDQLLLNLYDDDGNLMDFDLPDKSQYTFDDILKLDLTEKTYLVGKPLGQKFVFSNEYPFIADPFLVTEYDNLLEKSRRETSTLSSNLLLETGPIFRNTIYLCFAKDVFEIADINDISTEYTSKIYFPFLYQEQIEDIEELDTNRNKLIIATNEKLTPETERNFDNINMFYSIFQNQQPSKFFSKNMLQTGIKFLKLSIYPEFKIKIPVDVVFKLIHATQDFPLIKYNPETRQENMYRLFAPELTVDGRKIPYLNKASIFKLMRLIGKGKSVAVYTNIQYNGLNFYMTCEFEDNGVITVYPLVDFDKPIFLSNTENMFDNLDEIIKLTVNPLIEQIKPFFEQSGLEIPLFQSIQAMNVEIREMKYQTVYNIVKPIDINKLGGCVSSIFTVESSNFKKGIRMRYKRVSNYNKRDSQEAFIIEKIDQGYKFDEIVEELLQQFDDLEQESAEDLISKIRSELEVTRGANKRRALMIKINPGFQTLMNVNLITSELTVNISGINDIYYLNTIPVYIDSIIRITQDIDSCGIDSSKINTLCSGEEVDDIEFGQITAQSEQPLDDNEIPIIQDESVIYSDEKGEEQGEYMEDLLDILGFEEDESNEVEGGAGSESEEVSSESVRSEVLSDSIPKPSNIPSIAVPEKGIVSSENFQGSPELSELDLSDLDSIVQETKQTPSPLASSVELDDISVESEKSKSKTPAPSASSVELEDISVESEKSKSKTPTPLASSVELEDISVESEKSKSKTPTPLASSVELEDISVESKPKSKTPTPSKSKTPTPSVSSVELDDISVESKPKSKTPPPSKSKTPTPSVSSVELDDISVESKSKSKTPTPSKSRTPTPLASSMELDDISVESEKLKTPLEEQKEESFEIIPKTKEKKEKKEKRPVIEKAEEIENEPFVDVYEDIEIVPKKRKGKKQTTDTRIPSQKKVKEQVQQLHNSVRDITGMKLQYPNPFSARLEERMPQLFVKSKNEKIDLYTRMCPFSLSERRQPIILTKEERDRMVEEHPGEINEEADFIEYGTDAKDSSQKYYYTCPRYWCLLTDTMVTEDDILEGKCGPKVANVKDAIIPRGEETVPKGKYVYQFYGENERKYPGFHKKKTPSGLCIPCCYSNWSTPEVKNRRDICQGKFDEKKAEKVSKKEEKMEEQLKRDIVEIETYVKGPEKYGPQLGEHRWGFLPIVVQKFLHEVNEDCQVSKTNMSLKLHHTCILRHGVEDSATQSFIACIASAIFFVQKIDKKPLIQKFIPDAKSDVPTIKQMKQLIIDAIDLDNFIKYQNGDLITSFANPDLEVDINPYKNTRLYKKMESQKNKGNSDIGEEFIIKVIQSFETFKKFLSDDKIIIDYTYLWDLICIPNPKLFEAGVNLIVLEIPENDITNNIELVCPTNHYSVHTYDARKRSLILIKRENYFEPIYGYRNNGKIINITKTFSEYDKKLPKTLRAVFSKIIKPTLGKKCEPKSSMREYRFKQAAILDKLLIELEHKRYTVSYQVLNFQGKVIGVMARNRKGIEGFIPCYPSALTNMENKKCKKNVKQKGISTDLSNSNESDEDPFGSVDSNLSIGEIKKKLGKDSIESDTFTESSGKKTPNKKSSNIAYDEDSFGSVEDVEDYKSKLGKGITGGKNNDNCEYDFVYMNDNIWKPYEQTLEFLKEYYDYEEQEDIIKANCYDPKYFCRVVEYELITGFLTNTDQFVPIKDPIPVSSVDDNIKTITNSDMLVADIQTLTNNTVDTQRIDFIKRIQLETNFYNVFRNTIRILFNDYLNSQKRKAIRDECSKKYSLYKNQIDTVIKLLHDLVGDKSQEPVIIFASELEMPYDYKEINEKDLQTCISKTSDKCLSQDKKASICRITKDKCQLVLPKINLVNGTDNEAFYYGRMADELIRYNRIKSFIFKPQAYLSFGQVKYNLRDDEIIILQDLLTQEFFENLIPSEINRYAKYNTYDTAEPIISRLHNRDEELDNIINPYHVRDCAKSSPNKIKSGYWRKCFPDSFKEIEYTGSNYCSLYLIVDIVKAINGNNLTVEQIKDDLFESYSDLTDKFTNKERIYTIIDILREEAQFDANQLQDETMTFEQMIMQDGFVAVNFDLWLLLVKYKIPSIFISSKQIPETRFNSNVFVCYTEQGVTDYTIILTPAMYRRLNNLLPEYKLIVNNENININISILEETTCFNNIENAIINFVTPEDYLDLIFEKDITTKYKPRKKGMRQPIEFEIISASKPEEVVEMGEEEFEIELPKVRRLKGKKIKSTIILEEAEEAIENPEEILEIIPIKKRKTKKQREQKLKVNPPGKKGTRRKLPKDIEIPVEVQEIY